MAAHRLVCDLAFLERFRDDFHALSNNARWDELMEWMNLYQCIWNSKLSMTCTKSDFIDFVQNEREQSGLESRILKLQKNLRDQCRLSYDARPLSDLTNDEEDSYLRSSYLIDDINKKKQYESNKGVSAITSHSDNDIRELYHCSPITIERHESNTWQNVLRGIPQMNSLALLDRYIFANSDTIDKNLFSILETLLPDNLNVSFHLTIITCNVDVRRQYTELVNRLKRKRPNLNLKVSICKCSTPKFHDRCIITNNFFIRSSSGFDLFDNTNRAIHEMALDKYHRGFSLDAGDIIDKYLNCAKRIFNDRESTHFGEKTNRLFD